MSSLAKPAINTNLAENIYNNSPDLPSPHSSQQSSSASSTSSSAPSRSAVNNMSSTSTSQSTPAPGSPLTEPSASPPLPPHAQPLNQAPNNPTHHQNNNNHHHSTASVPPHSPLGTHTHSSNGFPPSSSSSASSLLHKPTMVEHGICRFLIMDAPSPHNLPAVIDALKKRNCVCVVRVCEPTYSTDTIKAAGIQHKDLPFADGDAPPPQVITEWMNLVRATFEPKVPTTTTTTATTPTVTDTTHDNSNGTTNHPNSQKGCIGVHCVAGLGRAPVLVAVALVEYGMPPMDAVDFIRKRRRGAINAKQLKFLESYKPQSAPASCSCIIS